MPSEIDKTLALCWDPLQIQAGQHTERDLSQTTELLSFVLFPSGYLQALEGGIDDSEIRNEAYLRQIHRHHRIGHGP